MPSVPEARAEVRVQELEARLAREKYRVQEEVQRWQLAEARVRKLEAALERIAAGVYDLSREACEQLALDALDREEGPSSWPGQLELDIPVCLQTPPGP